MNLPPVNPENPLTLGTAQNSKISLNTTQSKNIVTIRNETASANSSEMLSKREFHNMILEISG